MFILILPFVVNTSVKPWKKRSDTHFVFYYQLSQTYPLDNFDTVLLQFLETGTSDITNIGRD